ncbi:MAG: membrane protein insertion efficiency factor YidD [Deltaproteobacteria bacterium]|nr:membrane protein insertion efficiency factor YidD [Deltaproteobacteria bacterium]
MIQTLILLIIRAYKYFISPLLPPSCRFYPSCSDYAADAVSAHGAIRGTYYGVRRLLKCHPYHSGGYDPAPGVSINPDTAAKESSL